MKWLRVSLYAQAVLALYFQVVQWFPLGNWNYQPEHPSLSSFQSELPLSVLAAQHRLTTQDVLNVATFAAPFALFSFAYSRGLRWLMWLETGVYSAWLALQIYAWWLPYAFGRTDAQIQRYERVTSHATQLLPSLGRHLPPDGAHVVIQILLVAVLVSAVVGLSSTSPHAKSA